MAGLNLKQLLEKAKQAMKDNSPSDCFLQLKESLRDDFYWEAMSFEIKGSDMDNIEEVKTIGYGQTPEEALNELIGKLSEERQTLDQHKQMYLTDKLWKEIMLKAIDEEGHGISATIDTYTLRKILENHNILPKTKDGM